MTFLEISATVLGLFQGFLILLNKRSNWIFYILQMICMIGFSLLNRLYGDCINSSIYLILGVVGYITWAKKETSQITTCVIKEKIGYVLVILIATIIFYQILKNTDDQLPLIDAFTTTSSFVATYYMIKRKLDTWLIWFVNDIAYVYEYFMLEETAYYLMSLNLIWTFMAVISYLNWSKIMKGAK